MSEVEDQNHNLGNLPLDVWHLVLQYLTIQQLAKIAPVNFLLSQLAVKEIRNQRKHRRYLEKVSGFAKKRFSSTTSICCFTHLRNGTLLIGELINPKKPHFGSKITYLSTTHELISQWTFHVPFFLDACSIRLLSGEERLALASSDNNVYLTLTSGELLGHIETSLKPMNPMGVTSDDQNRLYVVDSQHHRVQVYSPMYLSSETVFFHKESIFNYFGSLTFLLYVFFLFLGF